MKKRAMSLLLVLVMIMSLFPFVASAEYNTPETQSDGSVITNPVTAQDASKNLNLKKELSQGANGTYDITMESWATGEVKTQGITEKIPTDFVLVVDQSGSMDTKDMPTGDPTVQNNEYLENIANGAYYYKDGDNYYRVYGVKDYLFRYYPANYWFTGDIVKHLGTDIGWFMGETDATTDIDNAFYFREVVGDQTYYIPIKTTIEGKIGTYYMRFSYPSKKTGSTYVFDREVTTYSSNGKSPWYKNVLNGDVMTSGALWATANAAVQTLYPSDDAYTYSTINLGLAKPRTGMYINYPMYGRHLSYTKLCYRDVNGVEHEVASNSNGRTTWEYCDDNGIARTTNSVTSARPTYSGLYTFAGTTDRITALKAALNEFAGAVANETDDFGAVDNRVSIVGFSSPNYSNTELLTHTERDISSGSTNGWQKGTCDNNVSEYYGKGLVGATNGNVGTVNPKITNAITAITANGGTQPEDGLNMAYQVLTNRSNTTYTIRSGEHKDETVDRNTIVIFFTDGQPGDYHYSDQYSEANEVVAQAKQIKDYGKTLDYGTSIFTIGVFGESDANPLTYSHATRTNSQGEDKAWKYLGGWMESYHDEYYPYSWYCLRRQWRPNSASASDNYTAAPNDTIFDYMSVVSSNYPDAEQFIAPSWLSGNYTGANGYTGATDGVRHKETAQTTNKYYRMASSQDTLVAAFLQAVTMNNEETTSETSVPLNETAVFKDKVNLADFDTTGATYTVKWQPVKEENGQLVNNGNAETKVNGAAYPAEGINYSGFNYSANFVTSAHPGQKLVITINGLTPKKTVGELKSNDGNAGVYGPEDEDPTVSITSPTLQFPESAAKTYVIDFNAKMTVATYVTKLVGATNDTVTGTNGSFVKSGTNVTYQLDTGVQTTANAAPVQINKAYSAVDSATVYGKLANVTGDQLGWKQITTIPAGSVYYDDDLTNASAVTVGDGSGYNAALQATPASQTLANGQYSFKFNGTGIDVYCTTYDKDENGKPVGYVQAKLDDDLTTMRSYSITERYNVPTISFRDLGAGEHTLTLNVLSTSRYKLDGIRVYNPVQNQDLYQDTNEQYAAYINMREALVNNQDTYNLKAFNDNLTDAFLGALFVDDSTKLVRLIDATAEEAAAGTGITYVDAEGNVVTPGTEGAKAMKNAYTDQFDAYKANSPKHEIYLSKNQAIIFQLSADAATAAANGNLWIGLSAPDQNKNTGTVTLKDAVGSEPAKTIGVTSGVDMYYPITSDMIGADRVVTIKNTGDNLISVTNLKITGNQTIYNAVQAAQPANSEDAAPASLADAMPLVFDQLTMQAVKIAANNGVDPDAPADPGTGEPADPGTPDQPDDPGADKPAWTDPMSLLKTLFQALLNTLGNLFRGLGGW